MVTFTRFSFAISILSLTFPKDQIWLQTHLHRQVLRISHHRGHGDFAAGLALRRHHDMGFLRPITDLGGCRVFGGETFLLDCLLLLQWNLRPLTAREAKLLSEPRLLKGVWRHIQLTARRQCCSP